MDADLKKILRTAGKSMIRPEGTVKVLVDLRVREPDEACLDRLHAIGLQIDQVIENKVIGSISAEHLDALKEDDTVADVELSVDLKRH